MVVVAIIGIVAAIAGPGISEQVQRTRQIADLDGVRHVLLEARNEARLRRGCAFVEGAAPGETAGHHLGLVVSIDVNCDGVAESTRPVVAVGEVEFQRDVSGSFATASLPRVTFEKLGNLHAGSAGAVLGFIKGEGFRRFRVVPAIGAVRQESP